MKNRYTVNSKTYSREDLIDYSKNRINNSKYSWEIDIYNFILEWFSEENHIYAPSSGSTGKPKIIKHNKKHVVESAIRTGEFFQFKKNQKILLCLPAKYIAGKLQIVRAFYWEMNLIIREPGLSLVIDEHYDFAAFTPSQAFNCIEYLDSGLISNLLIGGAKISQELNNLIQNTKTNVFQSFGMTETITHIAIRQLNKANRSLYYKCLKNVHINTDDNNELIIHSPEIGVNNLKTKDIVIIKDNNKFKWIGRFDNVINSGGIKLYPEEIEQNLSEFIEYNFFVSSLKDQILGEKLILIVETTITDATSKAITDAISKLSKYSQPKEIYYIDNFIRTETDKINRAKTKQLLNLE
ncbi:MAG: AMP-binding protein [Marinifilaceae bacterium]|nr:AMP-binding protein [Marinifilaceae bacterium]